ncbi:hypothetical protein MAR_035705 [Mya arenaria]|uniref:Uncharacterized protein n=1 Tax=Mya arenaria TaxID=6604 RepID=A0ABY7ENV7_MYAAR|nr:hypothetical protein MAR_035705 [Mya arenaria]
MVSLEVEIEDEMYYRAGAECFGNEHFTSAERFGQEHLCKTHEQRQMFQRAILGKTCSSSGKQSNTGFTNDEFMLFMVDTLCRDKGTWLADWVRQHVDTDDDERISRFEEDMYYYTYERSLN